MDFFVPLNLTKLYLTVETKMLILCDAYKGNSWQLYYKCQRIKNVKRSSFYGSLELIKWQ